MRMSESDSMDSEASNEDRLIEDALQAIKQAKKVMKACYVSSTNDSNESCFMEAISCLDQAVDELPETVQQRNKRKARALKDGNDDNDY